MQDCNGDWKFAGNYQSIKTNFLLEQLDGPIVLQAITYNERGDEIALDQAALDQILSEGIYDSNMNLFPIKRASFVGCVV